MIRTAPPLEAIEVFLAAAQARSFRSVARDLALSPSAVSRRIASLETFLGTQLFDRDGPVPTLSPAGRRYLNLVEPAMGAIQRATTELAGRNPERLTVATSHSFASTWLSPRLAALQRELGLEVEVAPTRDPNILRAGEAQLAIWGGYDAPGDLIAEHLFDASVVPVSARKLSGGHAPPANLEELADCVLLATRTPARLWERWFALVGAPPASLRIREFATLQLMYEAAAEGLGVALGLPLVIEAALESGRLWPCASPLRPIGECYALYRFRSPTGPSAIERRFVKWLQAEVRASVQRFEQTVEPSVLNPDHQRIGSDKCALLATAPAARSNTVGTMALA